VLDEPTIDEAPAEADAPAFDDLDTPADAAPADDALPADDVPADDLDAFDAPADAPADDSALPAEAAPADDALPGFDEPAPGDAPAETPADAPADGDNLDDLFGGNQATTEAEPRTARQTEPADDLFGSEAAAAPAATTPAPTTPAPDSAPTADDLFDAPATPDAPPAVETPPAAETPAGENKSTVDDLDDLFGAVPSAAAPATRPVTTPTSQELEVRVWTDNTGHYRTVGRLVKISPTHVRLLKDNGRFSTVAKDRLSQADLAYVEKQVELLGIELFDQLARR